MAREFDDKMESDFLNIIFRVFTADEIKRIVHDTQCAIADEEAEESTP